MNEVLFIALAFPAGFLLGSMFFGALWFTVKNAVNSNTPAFWIFGGFVLRMITAVIGFYYVSMGSWRRLLICLLGFVAARAIIMRLTKTIDSKPDIALDREGT